MHLTGLFAIVSATVSTALAESIPELQSRLDHCSAGFKNTVFNRGIIGEPDINGHFDILQSCRMSSRIRLLTPYIHMQSASRSANMSANMSAN
ncbi:hypothetical protein F5Y09DRAFT_348615 [Xylaria sp. FL1042]|nr:hypothetical protein F5Y09DRAFT_348615 [Xylaria sp. FL1042]